MTRYLFIIFLFFGISEMTAQPIHQMSFNQLQKKLNDIKDSIVVMNFWATWCKPCVEELPRFEELNKKYVNRKVKVILVSLDFNKKIKTDVEPFIKKKNLQSHIWHITDTDPNTWINKIDTTWSGAIPATVIYDRFHHKVLFRETQMTFDEMEKIILPILE